MSRQPLPQIPASFAEVKLVEEVELIRAGQVGESVELELALNEVREAVHRVKWPPGSNEFYIYPESGKKRGRGNGVVPIKKEFMKAIGDLGWGTEEDFPVDAAVDGSAFGEMDASKRFNDHLFLVEWETGNISSSHRSLNKAGIGLVNGVVAGAVIIVPSGRLAPFLTDRIGNIRELRGYFPLFRSLQVDNGFLAVFCIEQDADSYDVPRIPKGTDGRAME